MITEIYSNGRMGLGNLKKGVRMDITFFIPLFLNNLQNTCFTFYWEKYSQGTDINPPPSNKNISNI